MAGPAHAAELLVRVLAEGQPVADAVVSLHGPPRSPPEAPGRAILDQRNSAFEPGVFAIRVGTEVEFPNSDSVQHQVYSFSEARPFELPLYSGTPPDPILFDRPGVVVVGCNIHDWMVGHIVVLDTPYFGKTDADGLVRLEAPAGEYGLRAWHARLSAEQPELGLALDEGHETELVLRLELRPEAPTRRGSERLRMLQDRLRKAGTGR
ncbi:methylamine utilization protein [Arenimonas fontis]|uniref:Methylamine utilization protein n=1 Tax=Arenimonas fontis TaxID=2608255 RepID=A0A5B2ZGJ7_9GAMM|nr:methylamine utilization protein [Arenimonas fontis]